MSEDPYRGMAERYDLSLGASGESDPAVAAFFRGLFEEHGVRSVLDCACGTGRHLTLFHELGCEVYGSDLSAAMLERARANLTRQGIEVEMRQTDYRELPAAFGRQFDAVVCLNSIGYMKDDDEFLQAFRSMRWVLRDGGLLALTAMPTDRGWRERPRFLLNANSETFSRVFVMDYLERSVRYNILDIFHGHGREGMEVWSAELTILLRDDQERLLRAAGFGEVAFYGSFEGEFYDKDGSRRLIAVARR